jgi:hypothetical protein
VKLGDLGFLISLLLRDERGFIGNIIIFGDVVVCDIDVNWAFYI